MYCWILSRECSMSVLCHTFIDRLLLPQCTVYCILPGTVWHRQHCSFCPLVFCPWGGPVSDWGCWRVWTTPGCHVFWGFFWILLPNSRRIWDRNAVTFISILFFLGVSFTGSSPPNLFFDSWPRCHLHIWTSGLGQFLSSYLFPEFLLPQYNTDLPHSLGQNCKHSHRLTRPDELGQRPCQQLSGANLGQ